MEQDIYKIPEFANKGERQEYVYKNRETLKRLKRAQFKKADACPHGGTLYIPDSGKLIKANKANNPIENPRPEFRVLAAINTTNFMDSYDDVHLPGLWKKSLKENDMIMHLQEHRMAFDKIISDGNDLNAYTKFYKWSELGFDFEGETQVLVFDSLVKQKRNPYMHEQYAQGYVKNHSVGMRYVKLILAIGDENYGAEYEMWEKYYPEIVNKERADEKGYFWAVKEAKVIEGSAVPLGANVATPTLDNNKSEPISITRDIEPLKSTQEIDYSYLTRNFKI